MVASGNANVFPGTDNRTVKKARPGINTDIDNREEIKQKQPDDKWAGGKTLVILGTVGGVIALILTYFALSSFGIIGGAAATTTHDAAGTHYPAMQAATPIDYQTKADIPNQNTVATNTQPSNTETIVAIAASNQPVSQQPTMPQSMTINTAMYYKTTDDNIYIFGAIDTEQLPRTIQYGEDKITFEKFEGGLLTVGILSLKENHINLFVTEDGNKHDSIEKHARVTQGDSAVTVYPGGSGKLDVQIAIN
jgi:hypothetical protein